jgi:hypothetical protein
MVGRPTSTGGAMTDQLFHAWLAAADPDFGGSIDGWDAPPKAADAPEISNYQGVSWAQRHGHGYWRVRVYINGRTVNGRTFRDLPENELVAAHEAARLAGWGAPRLRADNPISMGGLKRRKLGK